MVDIHTHFLPEIDDGAKNTEESIAMLKESVKQGVSLCVATPHCVVHGDEDIEEFVQSRIKSFDLIKESEGIPEILLGAEVYMDNDLSKYTDISKLCIGDTPYMLVELSGDDCKKTAEWIYNLKLLKIKPIIAHIDRYDNYIECLNEFAELNVIYQVNASRFLTMSGRNRIKNIMNYTNDFIVSSDMHNTSTRPCNMKPAYEKAKKKFGSVADKLFFSKNIMR